MKKFLTIICMLAVLTALVSCGETPAENSDVSEISVSESVSDRSADETVKDDTPDIPADYKNALIKAQSYSDAMHMSKAGIYSQLTSEYGENFTTESADYAIENLNANYNLNALEKAKSYSDEQYMSKTGIYNQLVSEYGEQFTDSEAQYAEDNLVPDNNRHELQKAKSNQ